MHLQVEGRLARSSTRPVRPVRRLLTPPPVRWKRRFSPGEEPRSEARSAVRASGEKTRGARNITIFFNFDFFSPPSPPTTMMVAVAPQITAVQGEVLSSAELLGCPLNF